MVAQVEMAVAEAVELSLMAEAQAGQQRKAIRGLRQDLGMQAELM